MADTGLVLNTLIGERVLDGVDMASESIKAEYGEHFEDCEVIRFRLDGVTYCAVEDPEDGYRSAMRHLIVSGEPIKNAFPPVRVLATVRTRCEYGSAEVLQLTDMVTGKVVLEAGTNNTDDYYPWFVGTFSPENMAINVEPKP